MDQRLAMVAARKAAGRFIRAYQPEEREDVYQDAVLHALELAGTADWTRNPGEVVNFLAQRVQWELLRVYKRRREVLLSHPDQFSLVGDHRRGQRACEAAGELAWAEKHPPVSEPERVVTRKAKDAARKRNRAGQGLCVGCGKPRNGTGGKSRCGACMERRNSQERERRARKKVA